MKTGIYAAPAVKGLMMIFSSNSLANNKSKSRLALYGFIMDTDTVQMIHAI